MAKQVMMGFDPNGLMVPITNILPLKQLRPGMKATQKYQQVLASVREVGIIEPLIVFPDSGKSDSYFLLDGHVRLEVLKQLGATHARCLVSTDDEAYTYNKRVSRIARSFDIISLPRVETAEQGLIVGLPQRPRHVQSDGREREGRRAD